MCLLQVNWFKSYMVKANFAEVVNGDGDGDGVCLDALQVLWLW